MSIPSAIFPVIPSLDGEGNCIDKVQVFCWTLLLSILLCVPSFAQPTVTYSYDSAGNRSERTWSRGGAPGDQKGRVSLNYNSYESKVC